MDMEFKKLCSIIVEVLGVDESEITLDTTFVDDLGADSLDVAQISRSSWGSRKSLTSPLILMSHPK